jgi:hypothetical protein
MSHTDILPANFTISSAAKREIEVIRRLWNAQFADQAGVLMVGWGLYRFNSGRKGEGVIVSFYGESQHSEIAHGIQQVSGMEVVFFTIPQYAAKFDGKILDHAPERGFFLRARSPD